MISPILSYNRKVWVLLSNQTSKYRDTSPLEKGHLQFCKRYLQVNNNASVILRAGLKLAELVMCIDLHRNGKTSFYTNHIKMRNNYNKYRGIKENTGE